MTKKDEKLNDAILKRARAKPEGESVTAREFLDIASRAAIDQALSRLAKNGLLFRVDRGVYVPLFKGEFGDYGPDAQSTVAALARHRKEHVVESEADAANLLGLTTQVPMIDVFLTSGRSRTFTIGKLEVELRHSPAWKLTHGRTKPGLVLRAIAWLGPHNQRRYENRKAAILHLREKLTDEERLKLTCIAPGTPEWMTRMILEVANA